MLSNSAPAKWTTTQSVRQAKLGRGFKTNENAPPFAQTAIDL